VREDRLVGAAELSAEFETGAANEGAREFYAALGYQMEQVVLSTAIPAPSPL
jgi:hypothetical protein